MVELGGQQERRHFLGAAGHDLGYQVTRQRTGDPVAGHAPDVGEGPAGAGRSGGIEYRQLRPDPRDQCLQQSLLPGAAAAPGPATGEDRCGTRSLL